MRIAVPVDGTKISLQFAGSKQFKFYNIENNIVVRDFTLFSGVETLEDTARFLHMAGVQLVICCGIGGAGVKALDSEGVLVMGGILGEADEKILEFCRGTLPYSPIDPKRVHDHSGCHNHSGDGHDHSECTEEECSHCQQGCEHSLAPRQ